MQTQTQREYKPKIVIRNGVTYIYDYTRYREHANEHMRTISERTKPNREKTYEKLKNTIWHCDVCNMDLNYYCKSSHVNKSKTHHKLLEAIEHVTQ